jgi:succinate-semialdehyde dehydrogenase/glutarate-semialdehyde dehydrogenase
MQLSDQSLFRQQCYIDGEWVDADGGETVDVNNPADDSVLGTIPKMGADETRRAIEAANRAWPGWRKLTAKERAAILRRWFDLMLENQEDLAQLMTAEQGKPLAESRGEIGYGASFVEWFAEEGRRRGDHAMELPQRDDHPQMRPGAGRRLPNRRQTGNADALFRPRPG